MAEPLLESLKKYKERVGEPLNVLIVNTGGTFTCLPNEQGLLEPINSKEDLHSLLHEGLNLNLFVEKNLLKIKIVHLFSVDSSQMTDKQRDGIITLLSHEYIDIDGVLVIHGTDTGADTAKFLHLALPYFDPRRIYRDESRIINWSKPVIVLSSQVPAVDSVEGKLTYRLDSDGPMNLSLALMILADNHVGEAGIITNNGEALRGIAAEKGAEVNIPPYYNDPGVAPIAKYTALGLHYFDQGHLQKANSGTA